MSTARTVLANATIHTQDPAHPRATVLAIGEDGTILAFDDDALAHAQAGASVHDLGGAAVLPGLLDVHNHHWLAGQSDLFELEFSPELDVPGILDAVAAYAADLPADGWIVGGSWGSGLFEGLGSAEALAALDRAAGGRPVMLRDDSKHNRWASSAALAAAEIDDATPDPDGGHIGREASGRATGVLIESAGTLVERALARVSPQSVEDLARAAERGIEILHAHGITAFGDALASLQLLEALASLEDAGRLKAHVVTCMAVNDFIFGTDPIGEGIIAERERHRRPHHHPDFIKIFLDGVPPSGTGAFLEPYRETAGFGCSHLGHTTMPYDELEATLLSAAARGLSAKVHCTGDAAVRFVLDAAAAVRAAGYADVRIHVAHGQFVSPADVARFAELDVTADISPALWFPGVIPDALDAAVPGEVFARLQPNRELLDAGARLAFGSDWPVAVSPHVWEAVYGLVTRKDPTRTRDGALAPEQAITREEAIAAVTTATADALGLGDVAGRLAVGRAADFVVLSADPFACDVEELPGIAALETWVGGERVFERG